MESAREYEVLIRFIADLQGISIGHRQAEQMVRERQAYWRRMDARRANLSSTDQPSNFIAAHHTGRVSLQEV